MEIKTEKNLQEAFAGESQANRRYLFFAEKADKEGQPQIAKLFRAAADAETVHAKNHFNAMDGVGTTQENVMAGALGEHFEFTRMYPAMIEEAEQEENKRAQRTFEYANAVEKVHHAHFEGILMALKEGTAIKEEPYYVCQICGNTVTGAAPERCPICGANEKAFNRID
ncbi:rubrerythrin family protein [Chloroflexota bacterium]